MGNRRWDDEQISAMIESASKSPSRLAGTASVIGHTEPTASGEDPKLDPAMLLVCPSIAVVHAARFSRTHGRSWVFSAGGLDGWDEDGGKMSPGPVVLGRI